MRGPLAPPPIAVSAVIWRLPLAFASAVMLPRRSTALMAVRACSEERRGGDGSAFQRSACRRDRMGSSVTSARFEATWGEIRKGRTASGASRIRQRRGAWSDSMFQSANHTQAVARRSSAPQLGHLLIGGRLRAWCRRFLLLCGAGSFPPNGQGWGVWGDRRARADELPLVSRQLVWTFSALMV